MSTNRFQPLFDTVDEELHGLELLQGACLGGEHRDSRAPVETWRYRYAKRMLDVCGAACLLLLLAIPAIFIAVIIMSTSPGPVFYREERIGQYGRAFHIWKFRSMCREAAHRSRIEAAERGYAELEWRMQKQFHDPRITPIGSVLRNWSLDEIPQLINVLRGEMSLIGPRPIVQSEVALYGEFFRYYLCAIPGMSGLWQVSGRSGIGYVDRAKLDMHYVRSWSLALDLRILFNTMPAVLRRVGAA